MVPITLTLIGIAGALIIGYVLIQRMFAHEQVRARAFADLDTPLLDEPQRPNFLTRWLALAGFRDRSATWLFVVATLTLATAGLAAVYLFYSLGAAAQLAQLIGAIPGGVGATFAPVFYASPWVLALILATAPWLVVNRARKNLVALYEQDLPLSLDLLATLSESGLGFDTALTRIVSTRLQERPLAREFNMFQADMLAGRTRIDSLRRLARRTEVPSISVFVSALVQAEQMGSGLSGVLRRQADDLRDRRRERANAFAMSLPVKRLVPMVLCFLPGIFVWAVGPVMIQLFQLFDRVIQEVQS